MKTMTAEAKVGLMTIIGVLLLFFVVVGLSHGTLFRPSGMTVHVTFADANGLQAGNSVRYVGVNVGKVETVATGKDGVEVTLLLKKDAQIPKDSKAVITTDGLLGEKLVSITPGQDTSHLLADGGTLTGDKAKSVMWSGISLSLNPVLWAVTSRWARALWTERLTIFSFSPTR